MVETNISAFHINLVKNVEAKLTAVIGTSTLTVEQLTQLKKGHVVELVESIEHPVQLFMNDVLVAEGHLAAVDDKYAIEITKVAEIVNG